MLASVESFVESSGVTDFGFFFFRCFNRQLALAGSEVARGPIHSANRYRRAPDTADRADCGLGEAGRLTGSSEQLWEPGSAMVPTFFGNSGRIGQGAHGLPGSASAGDPPLVGDGGGDPKSESVSPSPS